MENRPLDAVPLPTNAACSRSWREKCLFPKRRQARNRAGWARVLTVHLLRIKAAHDNGQTAEVSWSFIRELPPMK
jgi:hypothetical protein